jgi:hypothetical protein
MEGKPPWSSRDPRERKQMYDWVTKKLSLPTWRIKMNCHVDGKGEESPRSRGRPKQLPYAVELAAEDVGRIRDLWQREYGKRNRRRDDGYSAVEIAAKAWAVSGVTEDAICARLKRPL